MAEEPDIINVSQEGIHTLSESGVQKGMPTTYKFSWQHPQTGKMMGPFMAIGERNLAFRQGEATKHGYNFILHED